MSIVNIPENKVEFYESNASSSEFDDPWVKKTLQVVNKRTGISRTQIVIKRNHQGFQGRNRENPNCGFYSCFFAEERMLGRTPEEIRAIKKGDINIFEYKEQITKDLFMRASTPSELIQGADDERWKELTTSDFSTERGIKSIENMSIEEFIDEYERALRRTAVASKRARLAYIDYVAQKIRQNPGHFRLEFLGRLHLSPEMRRSVPSLEAMEAASLESKTLNSRESSTSEEFLDFFKRLTNQPDLEGTLLKLSDELSELYAKESVKTNSELLAENNMRIRREVTKLKTRFDIPISKRLPEKKVPKKVPPPEIKRSSDIKTVKTQSPDLNVKGRSGIWQELLFDFGALGSTLGLAEEGEFNAQTCKRITQSNLDQALDTLLDSIDMLTLASEVF